MKNELMKNIKTVTGYAIALSMVMSSFGFVPAVAQAVGEPTLTIGSQSVLNGAHIVVPITGNNFTIGANITGLQFRVNYDNTLLSYTGFTAAATGVSTINNPTGNYINILWDHSSALVLNNATFVSLNFDVISSSTINTNLNHSNELVVIGGSTPGTATFVDGVISLNPASTVATVTSSAYTIGANTITNVPFGTSKATFLAVLSKGQVNQTWNDAGINNPVVTGNTLVVTAQDGTTVVTYTVTVNTNPDIALVASDKAALVDSLIQGANSDLSNITLVLTNPLPTLGANGSTITWTSNTPSVVSNDGQTVNRPAFANGNATVTLTATLTKGVVSDTKSFSLTVLKLPASTVATITSATYTVSSGGTATETITNIPFSTAKATFLAALVKSETHQVWIDTGISDPVVTGNTLIVTAQDGITMVTYAVTVNAAPVTLSSIAITTPATKLSYFVDEPLDTTGLVVTGTYSDASNAVVTPVVVTGFNSSVPVTGQVLTVTFGGKTTTYTVDIVAPVSSSKAITAFSFATPVATGVINEGAHTITVTVPFGTAVVALTPTIVITGASISPTSGVAQDFTSPVIYTVTADDASTQVYTVIVTVVAPSDISALTAAKSTAQGLITAAALESTIPGQHVVGSLATLTTALSAANATEASSQSVVDGQVSTLNSAISAYNLAIVPLSSMTAYDAALASKVQANYTTVTWNAYQLVVTANVVTNHNTQAEVDAATLAITTAQGSLVAKAGLEAYTAALATVHAVDYTTASWTIYQVIVNANVVTTENTQEEVTTATSNITAAQANLVTIADMTAYNTALSAVVEADYTLTSWATYQGIVTANVVTNQNLQSAVDTATANIVAAQGSLVTVVEANAIALLNTAKGNAGALTQSAYTVTSWATLTTALALPETTTTQIIAKTTAINNGIADLVTIANMTAYNLVLAAVTEANYTSATWSAYQSVVTANVRTDQDFQATVDASTLAITTAQGSLVADLIPPVISIQTITSPTQTSLTATWTTDHVATSRVVYDTVSHSVLGVAPNYGYANSTTEDTTVVTSHSVTITGLTAGTIYFFRTISRGSPEAVSDESSGTTSIPSSGGGGGYIKPATPAVPATKIEGCKPGSGDLFDIASGKSCTVSATPATPGQVLGASAFNFTKFMKNNSKGDEVIELQKFLNNLGHNCGTADGKFGPKTKACVIKFQLANLLKGDGIVGALTRAVLNK